MSLGHIVEDFYRENIGGAFLHGAMIPYFMASEVPRFMKNFHNAEESHMYPREVYAKGSFDEFNKEHEGPTNRIGARCSGFFISLMATASVIGFTDVSMYDVAMVALGTNALSLAYTDIPAVKKAAKYTRDLILNAGYTISRMC